MMIKRTVQVVNAAGLHARPCHAIVSTALAFQCSLRIRGSRHAAGPGGVNGKSILELMTLGAPQGSELELAVEGDGAEQLIEQLAELFARGFDES